MLNEVNKNINELLIKKKLSYQEKMYLLNNSIILLNTLKSMLIDNRGPCDYCIDLQNSKYKYCQHCGRKLLK